VTVSKPLGSPGRRASRAVGDAITTLLDAARADGTVRDDADARDVILLIGYLTRLDETEWDARANHVLDIILDGLRRRA
jgi:hypothetical protein